MTGGIIRLPYQFSHQFEETIYLSNSRVWLVQSIDKMRRNHPFSFCEIYTTESVSFERKRTGEFNAAVFFPSHHCDDSVRERV